MSDEQDSPISLSDDEDVIEQYKLDLQSEVIRITLEEIEQRVGAGEDISDEEKETMIEDNLKKVLQNALKLSYREMQPEMRYLVLLN